MSQDTVALALAAIFIFGCSKTKPQPTTGASNIVSGSVTRLRDKLNVHSSPQNYLEVFGRRYIPVRGEYPYYLGVPEIGSIFFVTEDAQYKTTAHFVNMATGQHIAMGPVGSLGPGIKGSDGKGQKLTDWVESAQSNRVTIVSRSVDWQQMYILDLVRKRLDYLETQYLDENE